MTTYMNFLVQLVIAVSLSTAVVLIVFGAAWLIRKLLRVWKEQ